MPFRSVIAALASLWVLGASTSHVRATQFQTPTFRSGLTVVPLDVRVADRKGASINDLTKDDFVVFEDGVQQEITHFERHVLTADAPGSLPARLTMAPFSLRAGNRRVFYIELGRLWLGTFRFGLTEALTKFLRERLLPQDYVVISSFGRTTDLTTDHEALAQVVERVAALHDVIGRDRRSRDALLEWRSLGTDSPIRRAFDDAFAPASSGVRFSLTPAKEYSKLLDAIVSHYITAQGSPPQASTAGQGGAAAGRALAIRAAAENIQSNVLVLLGALQYLRFIDGEKHLVYFPGWGFAPGAVEDDREIARVANDARVALHVISRTEGLPIGSLNLVRDMVAKNMSGWTGGSVFINRWPDEAFAKIDELTKGGYLLAYSPSKSAADERYRMITVRVKRPDGARVMVRDSYLSTDHPVVYDPVTYLAKQHMLTVAEFPGGVDDIGVVVRASSTTPGTITATIEIDVARVTFATEADRHVAKLELAVFCSDNRDRLAGQRWVTLDLKLKDDTMTKARSEGLRQVVTVPVSAQVRSVTAVVFDYRGNHAGAAIAQVK